jgi:hypothetical protein
VAGTSALALGAPVASSLFDSVEDGSVSDDSPLDAAHADSRHIETINDSN